MKFTRGKRGQSNILGAVLVFGLAVTALAVLQMGYIPQENSRVEFGHFQTVQNDMQDLRGAQIVAGGTNEPQTAKISAGLYYPSRLFFLNPPQVSGAVQTTAAGPITASDEVSLSGLCGVPTVTTRTFTYGPEYNEYSSARPIHIENTVQFRRGDDSISVDSGQVLIRGSQITLLPIVSGNLSTESPNDVSIDLIPATGTGVKRISEEDPDDADSFTTITVPSSLSAETWTETVLADEISAGFVNDVLPVPGGDRVRIQLAGAGTPNGPNEYTFRCTPIGANEGPNVSSLPTNGGGNDSAPDINPCCGSITYKEAGVTGADPEVNVTFQNTLSGEVTLTDVRFVYYSQDSQGAGGGGGGSGATHNPPDFAELKGTIYEIGGESNPPSGDFTIPGGGNNSVVMEFAQSHGALASNSGSFDVQVGDWYIVDLTFVDSGGNEIQGTYFIAPVDE